MRTNYDNKFNHICIAELNFLNIIFICLKKDKTVIGNLISDSASSNVNIFSSHSHTLYVSCIKARENLLYNYFI